MPPDGPDSWPEKDSRKQWLVFYRLNDMTFTGKGTIEGNGEKWWDLPCKPHRVILLYSTLRLICSIFAQYNTIWYSLFSIEL